MTIAAPLCALTFEVTTHGRLSKKMVEALGREMPLVADDGRRTVRTMIPDVVRERDDGVTLDRVGVIVDENEKVTDEKAMAVMFRGSAAQAPSPPAHAPVEHTTCPGAYETTVHGTEPKKKVPASPMGAARPVPKSVTSVPPAVEPEDG